MAMAVVWGLVLGSAYAEWVYGCHGDRGLGPARCWLDVAEVIGGHAVEAVGMARLAGEGGRG